jgi:folate-binding protein YgfZ
VEKSPLYEIHLDLGAVFGDYFGWMMPKHYVNPIEEYKSAKTSSVMIDRANVGKLRLWGKDVIDFMNRISTNDLRGLTPGTGAVTVLTDEKGKMIDVVNLCLLKVENGHQEAILFLSPGSAEDVKSWFDKLIIMDDVKYEDITDDYVVISVYGYGVNEVISSEFKVDHKHFLDISKMPLYNFVRGFIVGNEVFIVRVNGFSTLGYDVVCRKDDAVAIWRLLRSKGLTAVGHEVFNVLRVEAGIPSFGREITRDYNPLEANLIKFVSFSKGCYIGQEVLARIDSYNKLQKRLVGFMIEDKKGKLKFDKDAIVFSDDEEVGKVTSVVYSYGFQKYIALGYLKVKFAVQGEKLKIEFGGDKYDAVVILPPFSV